MHSSTLFFLLTVCLFALTISSAYPEEGKKEEKGGEANEGAEKSEAAKEGEEGKKDEGEKGKEEGKDKDAGKSEAISLFSSSGFFAVLSLALSSLILSIH